MKYNAKRVDPGNTWAVFTGQRFFPKTECATKEEAHIQALEMTRLYHFIQAEKAHRALEALGQVDEDDPYGWRA